MTWTTFTSIFGFLGLFVQKLDTCVLYGLRYWFWLPLDNISLYGTAKASNPCTVRGALSSFLHDYDDDDNYAWNRRMDDRQSVLSLLREGAMTILCS